MIITHAPLQTTGTTTAKGLHTVWPYLNHFRKRRESINATPHARLKALRLNKRIEIIPAKTPTKITPWQAGWLTGWLAGWLAG